MPEASYDLFVIGGGINGAAIACDAAGRGLSVALAEMQDFAEGTSSRSSKLIHGGLRYLETYDFKMVRDALREREILMSVAPHLVWPLRLVLPHVEGQRPRWMIRAGLFLYDHLAPRRKLPGSEYVDLRTHPAGKALKPEFRHAFAYSDCRGDDSRLVIANLLGAERHGAVIYPRHQVTAIVRDGDGWRLGAANLSSGERLEVTARAVVNAAGPWVIGVGRLHASATRRRLRLVKGSHIVVPRLWDSDHGYFLQTSDNRLMEAFPYEEQFTSIGTTDEPWEESPETVRISDHEVDYMITEVNRFLRRPVRREDIVYSYSGVRPLFESGGSRDSNLSTLTRDYSFEIEDVGGQGPILTIFGGKLTTHRRLAAEVLGRLAHYLRPPHPSRTSTEPLPGGDLAGGSIEAEKGEIGRLFPWLDPPLLHRYVRTYGSRTRHLLTGTASMGDLGEHFGGGLHAREVDFLMATEWAGTADDVLWRRTKLGLHLNAAKAAALDRYMASKAPTFATPPSRSAPVDGASRTKHVRS